MRQKPERLIAEQLQSFDTALLIAIAEGDVSAVELAKRELCYRGLDKSGRWVGIEEAWSIHLPA